MIITFAGFMSFGSANDKATSAMKGNKRMSTHIIIAGVETPRGIFQDNINNPPTRKQFPLVFNDGMSNKRKILL